MWGGLTGERSAERGVSAPLPGLSLMSDAEYREVVAPLFDSGQVGVVEWTVDMGWPPFTVPEWAERILSFYGDEGRLFAHGFALSALSGDWSPGQDTWLERLAGELRQRRYAHVSEHFCFSRGGDFIEAGPLPVPMTPRTIGLGRERVKKLAEVAGAPVGLENLATSLGRRDALDQGEFLDRLLEPVNGFVVLDVHNLFCQCQNFELAPEELLATYPLARVREIHVSGGGWDTTVAAPDRPVRRDTHDGDVPDEVFALLELALDRCSNVETVILERLPGTFGAPGAGERFRDDYGRVVRACRARETARA